MKVTVVGSGYVGLVTGACLAELGNQVFCLDLDQKKIDLLNGGGVPIYEPGLEVMIARNHAAGRMQFSTDIEAAVAHGDIQYIAVGTPPHYQFDPVQTTKTSVHGAINMLGLAKRLRAKILQASTSEVYGGPEIHPQTEEYWGRVNPVGIRSCYDEGKRCAETLFF